MAEHTEIAWTEATFNPWIGCDKVSPGCDHCYAEARDRRVGDHLWGADAPRRRTTTDYWRQPLRWQRNAAEAGVRRRVFCASLADVFEDRRDLDPARADLFELIEATPNLIWQLLTKRPQNVERMVPLNWFGGHDDSWPSNVWIGTTVEDQQRADERIPELLKIPAAVRFLSCEPLIGRVSLVPWIDRVEVRDGWGKIIQVDYPCPIQWVIIGGESGPGFRPLELDHAREVLTDCQLARIPVFFKQVGGRTPKAGGDLLDGVRYHEMPTVQR